jgi:predicted nucleic acid-binding protein
VGLTEALGRGPIAVDTAVFIYLLEEHPTFLPVVLPIFQAADRGEIEIVSSGITLLEVLVVPYRAGDLDLAERYEALLTRSRGVRLIGVDPVQLRTAAQLRAVHGVRTPDALQLAAALTTRCSALVTNDRRFPDVRGLPIVQLSDHV